MRNALPAALGAAVLFACSAAASADVYNDRTTFLANVQAGFFENNFSSVAGGSSGALNFSGNGFSYTVDSTNPSGTLFNGPGVISVNNEVQTILVTFTGGSPTAIGGNFFATDFNLLPITATVTATLSNGTTETFTSSSANDFRGFTSNVPITTLEISEVNGPAGELAWPTMDNLIVGYTLIPEPTSLGLVGLAGLTLLRRRR